MGLSAIWTNIETTAIANGAMSLGASGLDDRHAPLFEEWIARGLHASMGYLAKNLAARLEPRARFPWAKSVIAIAVPYSPERPDAPAGALSCHIARYALGDDYHEVLSGILAKIEHVIRGMAPEAQTRRYVDTGPLSDRSYAAQAGVGWIGRNGMLINPERGSYFFIGTLLTSLENDLQVGELPDRCGTCTRCIDECPTEAILPGRLVDSLRCISHATIEQRGAMATVIKDHLEGNVFGCDICQEVCPWNSKAVEGHPAFAARDAYRATPVTDLLRMSQTEFSTLFRKSAIKRARRAGMIRNAVLVTGAAPESDADDAGIRDAVAWTRRVR